MTETPAYPRARPRCPQCGSIKWVSVSLDEGWTRRAQCIPCGAYHAVGVIGPGYKARNSQDKEAVHPDYRKHWAED